MKPHFSDLTTGQQANSGDGIGYVGTAASSTFTPTPMMHLLQMM